MNTPRAWATVRALGRSTAKALAWAALFLTPGALALVAGREGLASLLFFVGSFGLVARTYRKEWRLNGFSTAVGPLCAALCLAVQWALLGGAAPSLVVVGASAGLGLGLGAWHARSLEVYVKDRAVFARRTIGYLLVWAVCYGVTLAFAQARNLTGVRIGLAGSIVSAVTLCVLGRHLWGRYRTERTRLAGLALGGLVVGGMLLLPATPSRAQPDGSSAVLDAILHEALAPLGGAVSEPFAASESSFNGSTRAISIRYGDGTSLVLVVRLRRYDSAAACRAEGRRVMAAVERGVDVLRPRREGDPFPDATPLAHQRGGLATSGRASNVRPLDVGDHAASWTGWNRWIDDAAAHALPQARIHGGVWRVVVDAPMAMPLREREGGRLLPRNPLGPSRFDTRGAQDVAGVVARALFRRLPAGGASPGWAALGGWSTFLGAPVATEDLPRAARIAAAIAALILVLAGVARSVAEAMAEAWVRAALTDEGPRRRRSTPSQRRRTPPPRAAPRVEPPPIDPRTGRALQRGRDDRFLDPDTGALLTREQAEMRIVEIEQEARRLAQAERGEAARFERQRDRERAAFDRETSRRRGELAARAQEQYEEVRREILERKRALEDLEHVERAATRLGDEEILARTGSDRIFGPDGRLDADYLRKVRGVLRDRLAREAAAPDEALKGSPGDWIVEGATKTMDDASKNPVIRLGTGILSGGTSEVVWQSWTAGTAMKEAAEKAADEGRDMSFGEAFDHGMVSLVDQNAPTATVKALGRWRKGEPVSWTELGLAVVGDVLGTVGLMGDMRSVAGGLTRSLDTARAGWKHGFTPGSLRELSQNARYVPMTGTLDAFARGTLDPTSFRNLSNAVSGAKQSVLARVRGAFDGLGLEGRSPSHRLTPEQAEMRFQDTRLGDDVAGLLPRVRGDADVARLDDAFRQGRAAGRERVVNLRDSIEHAERLKRFGAPPEEIARAQRAVRDDVLRVQADKHALNEMNALPRIEGENQTVRAFNQEMKDIYHQTDVNVKRRLAQEYGVRVEDIKEVEITNMAGGSARVDPRAPARDHYGLGSKRVQGGAVESPHGVRASGGASSQPPGAAPRARGDKVSFDRDLTMRVRTVDAHGNVVWKDIPSNTTGRIYNEELAKVALGRSDVLPSKGLGFENTHLRPDDHLADVVKTLDADKLAKRLDQATTDRLHPEAYGTGQADLDAATKDAFRGRDLTDPGAVAKTIEFKVHHWMKEADELQAAAAAAGDPATTRQLLQQATAHQEEGMRQLVKQYRNMGITRTNKMVALDNAAGASIPRPLAEGMSVLKGVQDGHYSAPQAEAVLQQLGTSTEGLALQFSAYVEGLQTLRKGQVALPSRPFPSLRLGRDDA